MNTKEYCIANKLSEITLLKGRRSGDLSHRAAFARQRLAELETEGIGKAEAKVQIASELETTPRQVRALLNRPVKIDPATVFASVARRHQLSTDALRSASRETSVSVAKNEAAYVAFVKGASLRAIAIHLGGTSESAALRRVRLHEKTLKP